MSVGSGRYELGPEAATLSVRTERAGAAAKAGHDLLIRVEDWRGTLEVGEDGSPQAVELTAEPASLRVIEGTGGMQSLGDDDIANIHQTIRDEVLGTETIEFRSSKVDGPTVEGELKLKGAGAPVSFDVELGDDGSVTARAVVTQTEWGIKPYSALFGALKVKDEVVVSVEGTLPEPRAAA
jgi:polyisoprenoid-binding protein YceI